MGGLRSSDPAVHIRPAIKRMVDRCAAIYGIGPGAFVEMALIHYITTHEEVLADRDQRLLRVLQQRLALAEQVIADEFDVIAPVSERELEVAIA